MIERSSAVTRPIGIIGTIAIAFPHVAKADRFLESVRDQPRSVACRIFASAASYSAGGWRAIGPLLLLSIRQTTRGSAPRRSTCGLPAPAGNRPKAPGGLPVQCNN